MRLIVAGAKNESPQILAARLARRPPPRKASKEDLDQELESLYRRTGEATGYWPNYFLRSVRDNGGLAVARKLLAPGSVSSGFDKLIAARRADLSVEAVVLQERFSHLFTAPEREVARSRLEELPQESFPDTLNPLDETLPDEVIGDEEYPEGATKTVRVNQYERNPKARAACIRHFGARCKVCGFDFEERYGEIGKDFIHVHHRRPLARLKASYKVNPKTDLVPVCPNCHAMLHKTDPPLDVEQLQVRLR